MEPVNLKKYPRTPHLEGSRLQPGDEDLSQIPFSYIQGKHLVVEEKVDGANSAISFDEDGTLLLQSRGHYLTGGYRERHYNLMKQWAGIHQDAFFNVLDTRYILYGEWLYAKHTRPAGCFGSGSGRGSFPDERGIDFPAGAFQLYQQSKDGIPASDQ